MSDPRLDLADVLLGNASEGVVVCRIVRADAGEVVDFEYVLANDAGEQLLGAGPLVGKRMFEVFPASGGTSQLLLDVARGGPPCEVRLVGRNPEAAEFFGRWFEIRVRAAGEHLVIQYRDVTGEEELAQAAAFANRRFEALVDGAADAIQVYDAAGSTLFASRSAERLLGYGPAELVGRSVFDLVLPADHPLAEATLTRAVSSPPGSVFELDCRVRRLDGETRWVSARVVNHLQDPAVQGLVVNWRDVTERRSLQDSLAHQALHDGLTGLPNRQQFAEHLQLALDRGIRRRQPVGVICCDVDRFTLVNNTLGHAAGDELLLSVVRRLRSAVRPGDLVARIGGDELVVLCQDLPNEVAVLTIAQRAHEELTGDYRLSDAEVPVSVSMGVAVSSGGDGVDLRPADRGTASRDETGDRSGHRSRADQLLAEADAALHAAKRRGRRRVEVFDQSLHELARRRLTTEAELRRAMQRGELVNYYQPIVNLRSGDITGMEALLRWNHPERGLLGPGEFLDVAEETALIVDIGGPSLARACSDAAALQERLGRPLRVAFNLCARQLASPRLLAQIDAALDLCGLDPTMLELEVTEHAILDDLDAVSGVLSACKKRGLRVALDDFGTGYSSLVWLQRLPVDTVKLDRSFIRDIRAQAVDMQIVRAVIELAHVLGTTTTGEGVEDEQQRRILAELGCDEAQGYHLAVPAAFDDVRAVVLAVDDD